MREYGVLHKNTTQCPRPGLEPGPLDPETSPLTMRPPRLLHLFCILQGSMPEFITNTALLL